MGVIKKIIKQHIGFRKQIINLAKVEFKKENSNSLLGGIWNIIKPLVIILVYWFAFEIGLRSGKDINGQPFFLWLLVGIIPWFYISEMLIKGSKCIKKNSYLVNKMKFPSVVIPTFVNLSSFMSHLMLMVVVFLIYLLFKQPITIYIIQLPIYMLLTFTFLNLWSFLTSFLVVFSKDLANLIKSTITALFWLSGIIWNVENVDIAWIQVLLKINPITFLTNGYRNCFINQEWIFESPLELAIFGGVLLGLAILGILSYKKLRREIPDVL